jgi:hypothetical protein
MLDQRKPGLWEFNKVKFNYQPFYVGIGVDYRMTAHFTPFNLTKKSIKNNIIKSICSSTNELPIYYKVYENILIEEANSIETEIIKHFGKIKDKSGILSNLTNGGDGTSGYNHSEEYKEKLRKKLYQYDIDGNFLKEWNSLKDVINFYELSGGTGIRRSIKNGDHCKGYLWSYTKLDKLKPHFKKTHRYNFYIYKNDILVNKFNSKEEIDLFFNRNISMGNVSSCCNEKIKTYLGYKWKKEKVLYSNK